MGEVYRARDPALGRDVAIKVLPEGLAADAERFEREAHALEMLNHPHIVTIHSVHKQSVHGRRGLRSSVRGEKSGRLRASS